MNVWHDIDARRITPERFIAVVEITKGGKQKYEMEMDPSDAGKASEDTSAFAEEFSVSL